MPLSLEAKSKILKIVHDTVDLAAMLMIPEVTQNKECIDDSSDTDSGVKVKSDTTT